MKLWKIGLRVLSAALCFGVISAQAQVGKWVYKAHMLSARRLEAAATGIDDHIYVFGGWSTLGRLLSAEAYDPSTDTWSPISDEPDGIGGAAATLADGRIFLSPGALANNTISLTPYAYHPDSDTYTTLADMPTGCFLEHAALGNDGNLYGTGNSPSGHAVFCYNVVQDKWSIVGPWPNNLLEEHALTADSSGLIYATGGEVNDINTSQSKSAFTLDGHAGAWSTLPDMSTGRAYHAAAFGGDGRIYMIGGEFDTGNDDSVEAYDPGTGAWSAIAKLQTSRGEEPAVTDLNGRIYVLGGMHDWGEASQVQLNSVECYQPSLLFGVADNISMQEGAEFSGEVAKITDKDLSQSALNMTASIDWGDGAAPTTASVAADVNLGAYKVSANHTYAEEGTYTTTITINDADGESISLTGKAKISDALFAASALNFNASTNTAFSGKVATISDANLLSPPSDFTATINWGDGSPTSSGTVAVDTSGGFDVSGSHTYSAVGSYTTAILVSDAGGLSGTIHGTATVNAPPPVVTVTTLNASEGSALTGQVASFTDGDPTLTAQSFSASINWGDGVTTAGTVTGSGSFTVSGTHIYAEEGIYAITVTVSVQGSTGSSNGTVYVADAPLTATGFSLTCKGTNFSNTVATFTDADAAGTAGDYSAAIFWGDGKSSTGTVVAAGAGFKVEGAHSYLKRGRYTVTITISDVGGKTTSATTHINAGPVK